MADREIATAADYADAMLTARRAKHVMVLLLLLMLLAQFAFFFVLRFTDVLPMQTSTVAVNTPLKAMPVPGVERIAGLTTTM